jgi:hypothetical protein
MTLGGASGQPGPRPHDRLGLRLRRVQDAVNFELEGDHVPGCRYYEPEPAVEAEAEPDDSRPRPQPTMREELNAES